MDEKDSKTLAKEIVESTENYKNIDILLSKLTESVECSSSKDIENVSSRNKRLKNSHVGKPFTDDEIIHNTIHSLEKVFSLLRDEKKRPKNYKKYLDSKNNQENLNDLNLKYKKFEQFLLRTLPSSSPSLQVSKLNALLSMVKAESERKSGQIKQWNFNTLLFQRIIDCFLSLDPSTNFCAQIITKYIKEHHDFMFYFQKCVVNRFKSKYTLSSLVLDMLLSMPVPPPPIEAGSAETHLEIDSVDLFCDHQYALKANHDILNIKAIRSLYTECWIKTLQSSMSMEVYKKVLLVIHKKIIPHLTQPTLLIDFLSDSYTQGGVISLLALNGLFTLIQDHNLDYPDFFPKLYTLLDGNILHVKYRSRFFRMLEMFLSSALLPSNMVAAFIKRLARLCLFAPPAGILIVLPMIYNLLRVHPSCIRMIHLQGALTAEDLNGTKDPYSFEESRPEKSQAESSYLWELVSLKHHYHPSVATLAKIFEEPLTQPSYDLEDFLDLTYEELVEQELKLKRNETAAPLAIYQVNLFDVVEADKDQKHEQNCFSFY